MARNGRCEPACNGSRWWISGALPVWIVLIHAPMANAGQGTPTSSATPTTPTFLTSVTAPYEVIEEIGTTRRIDRAEIEARHARTLDEALRLVPGIYIRTGGEGSPRIDVRGFRSRHVLLLIDGVPFNSTVDGQFDPARIPTEGIREITISYGSSSVLYGDNAMAAVIEIVTGAEKPASAGLDLTLGTPDERYAGGRIARSYGRFDLMVSGSAFGTDGFRLAGGFPATAQEDGGRRENSDRSRQDLRANLGFAVSPAFKVATAWTLGTGEYGMPPTAIDDPADIFAPQLRFDRVDDYRIVSGQLSLAFVPSSSLDVRGWVYRNAQREDRARYDDDTYTSIDDPLVPGTFQSRDRTVVTGSSALGRVALRRAGWLRLALNQRREGFESDGVIRDLPIGDPGSGSGTGSGRGTGRRGGDDPVPVEYALRPFATDRHVDVYSAGGEWQVRLFSRLGAVLGAASNWQSRPDAGLDAEPTWIAGLSYELTPAVRLHASAARKIRFPSIDQLYDVSTGNVTLRPERADGFDAGVGYRWGQSSRLGVSVYRTRAVDFIERIQGAPFANQDRYRFTGAEVTVETRAIPTLEVQTAYTFLDAVNLAPGTRQAELQNRPRHQATLEAIWRFAPGFRVRAAVHGVADQRYYSRGSTPLQARADDYTLVEAVLTRTLSRRYELALGVNNLFDRAYEQSYGLPREGRAAFLSFRSRFD